MAEDPDDLPPVTDAEWKKFRPAAEVLPPEVMAAFRTGGRPRAAVTKTSTTIRLDCRIVDAAKREGPAWQTRINDALLTLLVVDPETKAEVLRPTAPTKAA